MIAVTRGRVFRLATQFTLLLLATLVFANLIAALLLAREGSAYDRAVRLQGDMGRLVALVGALEAADPQTGALIVAQTSTGFTRFSLSAMPLYWPGAIPAPDLVDAVSQALPGHPVRIHDASAVADEPSGRVLTVLSVQITHGAHAETWLNAIVYPLPDRIAWQWKRGFFVPLAVSFVAALMVGLIFVRHMTRPLRELAQAARVAGQGDRSARVTVTGAQELRAAAIAFNDMQGQIADFDAERSRLVAALGHDLRTPITGLRIRAEMLDDPEMRSDMVRILDDMTVMANDLLNFSGGLHEGEPRHDIDMAEFLACLCQQRGVPFQAGVPLSQPVHLRIRPVAMARAVGNLIDNALRYAGTAHVTLSVSRVHATITVLDDGPGITPDQLATIRAPFTRGDASRSDRTGGVGLGLSIAEGIVRDHDGWMDIDNRATGGLQVRLHLPLTSAAG
ncbi:MAG TPA: ATP-binding protein [Paenirhodobacter sp.]